MPYRPISTPEFVEALIDRSQHRAWEHVLWFARTLYGPHAWRIVIESAWRDVMPTAAYQPIEPCVEQYLTAFTVYDQRGRLLEPDLRLPAWQERFPQRDVAAADAQTTARVQVLDAANRQCSMIVTGSTTYRPDIAPVPRMPPLVVGGNGLPYRPVRDAEVAMALHDLGATNEWAFFATVARDVYGPRAAQIDLIGTRDAPDATLWPAWDEQRHVRLGTVVVTDAANVPLAPDLTTAWWQDWLHAPATIALTAAARTVAMEAHVQAYTNVRPFLSAEHATYAVATPPARRGPILSIREPDRPA